MGASFALMAYAMLAGCGLGTVCYLFSETASGRSKRWVLAIYVGTWIVDRVLNHINPEVFPIAFLVQVVLCIYFVFFWQYLND